MNEDTRRVELTPEGLFIIGYKKLTLSCIKARKTRVEGKILDLEREQRSHEGEIKRNAKKIEELELELATFNSPEVLAWIHEREKQLALKRERQREQKIEANQRAKAFLHEYLGEEAYAELMKKGSLAFSGRDGRSYELTSKGVLLRAGKRVCVIHPRNLPLPDFIISVLTTVKEGRL